VFRASVTSLPSLSLSLSLSPSVCSPAKRSNSTQSPPHELFSKAILQNPTMRPSRGEWRGNRVGGRCGPPFSTCSVKTRSAFIRVYGRRRERKRGELKCLLRAERRNLTQRVLLAVLKSARNWIQCHWVGRGSDSRYSSFFSYSLRNSVYSTFSISDLDSTVPPAELNESNSSNRIHALQMRTFYHDISLLDAGKKFETFAHGRKSLREMRHSSNRRIETTYSIITARWTGWTTGVAVIYRRERDCVPLPLCKITTTTGSPRPLERNVGPTRGPGKGERVINYDWK